MTEQTESRNKRSLPLALPFIPLFPSVPFFFLVRKSLWPDLEEENRIHGSKPIARPVVAGVSARRRKPARPAVRRGQAQTSEAFGGNIVLGRPTDRSITVNVLFPAAQDAVYLEYGETSGALTNQTVPKTAIAANVPFEDVIDGLQGNRRYYYRVRFRGPGQTTFGASAASIFPDAARAGQHLHLHARRRFASLHRAALW